MNVMETAITRGIKVSVEAMYQPNYSKPLQGEFVHAYRITIENQTGHSVQLLRRHWNIWDSNGRLRQVDGEGVIGEQPIIKPMDLFQYVSGCPMQTEIGYMEGYYTMYDTYEEFAFRVNIPRFQLIVPFKYN